MMPVFIIFFALFFTSILTSHKYIQGSPKECFPGLVNLVTAAAYHFCLNLPRAFSQLGKYSFEDPCKIDS